jgi:hypothetical protein
VNFHVYEECQYQQMKLVYVLWHFDNVVKFRYDVELMLLLQYVD